MQGRRRPRAKEQRERPADRARVAELARSRRRAAPRTPSRSSRTRSRLHSPVDGTACCLAELQAKVSSSRSREVASPPYLQQSPDVTSPPRLPNESYLFRYAAACCLGDPRCPRRTPSCTEPSTRSASATSGTRSSEQTAIRSARRRRGRFVRRRDRLMETLVGAGLMPVDRTVRKSLERLDPYALRKEALDRRLSPSEMWSCQWTGSPGEACDTNVAPRFPMAAVTFKSVPSPMTTENVTNRTVKAPLKTGQNAAPGGISRPQLALRGTSLEH